MRFSTLIFPVVPLLAALSSGCSIDQGDLGRCGDINNSAATDQNIAAFASL
jgi:hypothetical protein